MSLAERIAAVRERIARAAARAHRDGGEIRLVAVSKNHSIDAIRAAHAAGLRDFGENRVQEAEEKWQKLPDLRAEIRWHFIGHLQGNKARKAVAFTHLIHSVDSLALAERLDRLAQEQGRLLPVLIQVDLAQEAAKSGVAQERLCDLLERVKALAHLRADGLMLLPPYAEDPERVRPFFARLRALRDEAVARGLLAGRELSMGMSHDLDAAIEEGSTCVRVGTAIFGERPRPGQASAP
ncbi:MAG: YggS family pyridoxal phosphate-dependent enzyme [Vicinamibacteria bacterium]|jgi:hypothetical protein|nr:YggS family pyridoxal phosphate-dependent enzyme [Vicinamibacteria bacterium]